MSGEIIFIEGEKSARFPDNNCLFISDGVSAVIDPATRPGDLERLHREYGVGLVINTHYHVDHTRYNRLFKGASVAAHPADAPAIESLEEMAHMTGLEDMPWVESWKKVMRDVWGYTETRVSNPVKGGEEISLGKNTLRFVHTPGHTPGHTCVLLIEKRAVYLADIDLTPFGPWYGNRYSDIDDFLLSIEKVKSLGAETWYTSHEEGFLRGDISGRLDAFAAVIAERDERILDFLSTPRTLQEMIAEALIYRKRWDPPQVFEFFEGTMVSKHLARLEGKGLVAQADGRWYRADS